MQQTTTMACVYLCNKPALSAHVPQNLKYICIYMTDEGAHESKGTKDLGNTYCELDTLDVSFVNFTCKPMLEQQPKHKRMGQPSSRESSALGGPGRKLPSSGEEVQTGGPRVELFQLLQFSLFPSSNLYAGGSQGLGEDCFPEDQIYCHLC